MTDNELPLAFVGTRRSYVDYCREHGASPDAGDPVFVSDAKSARGHRFRGVVYGRIVVGDSRMMDADEAVRESIEKVKR